MKIANLGNRSSTGLYDIYNASRDAAGFDSKLILDRNAFFDGLKDEEVVVLFKGEKRIGFVSLYEPQSFIHHFYIHPEYQGQGYGLSLLKFIVNSFSLPLSLKCELWNKQALSFYKATGWEELNRGIGPGEVDYVQLIYGLEDDG